MIKMHQLLHTQFTAASPRAPLCASASEPSHRRSGLALASASRAACRDRGRERGRIPRGLHLYRGPCRFAPCRDAFYLRNLNPSLTKNRSWTRRSTHRQPLVCGRCSILFKEKEKFMLDGHLGPGDFWGRVHTFGALPAHPLVVHDILCPLHRSSVGVVTPAKAQYPWRRV